jgi:hypothetical protein
MTTKNILPFILSILSIVSFGQENIKKSYSIEFEWQKDIANKPTKTIEDYFFLLPSSFLDCEGIYEGLPTKEKREKIVNSKDIKNGYLEFYKTAQLALFKDRLNSKDIVALQIGRCGAGSTCGALNTLLEFVDNKWLYRVELLPNRERMEDIYNRLEKQDICPYFDLPKIGTTILIRDENSNDSIILKYKWTGQKFELLTK